MALVYRGENPCPARPEPESARHTRAGDLWQRNLRGYRAGPHESNRQVREMKAMWRTLQRAVSTFMSTFRGGAGVSAGRRHFEQ